MTAEVSEDEEDFDAERRGRPRELKSYVFEVNGGFPNEILSNEITGTVENTGLQQIKILRLLSGQRNASFFLDRSDERFLVLHTGGRAEDTHRLVDLLANSPKYQFDRAWIPTQLLQDISTMPGNVFNGFGLDYQDYFAPSEETESPVEELNMFVSGTIANKALDAVMSEKDLQRSIAYTRTRIKKGTALDYSRDDISFNGLLSVRSGKSIDDHIALVNETLMNYRQMIEKVELLRIGTKEVSGTQHLSGKAFNLVFDRKIEDLAFFLDRLLGGGPPFRLWGTKSKLGESHYQALALDLHTGHPIDLEASTSLIRVYLPSKSCGNSLLRLYVNLQRYFDSGTRCEEIFS